jgi:hypothetical protein
MDCKWALSNPDSYYLPVHALAEIQVSKASVPTFNTGGKTSDTDGAGAARFSTNP